MNQVLCPHCLSYVSDLRAHIKQNHNYKNQSFCQYCEEIFDKIEDFLKHLFHKHKHHKHLCGIKIVWGTPINKS